jgi:AraC-like DNA-binding protein
MSFLTRRPGPTLRGVVDRLWHVEGPASPADAETICPDGRTELVLHLGAPMRERRDGHDEPQPRHLLVGQMEQPVTVIPTGGLRMVGARLEPAALHRLLPMPQDRLAGRIVDLESIWGVWTREAADSVAAANTPAEALDRFERALERLIAAAAPIDVPVASAIARLQKTGGTASITRLAADLGLGRRQLERRFRDRVGLSPRLFGRIVRFQRAFQALDRESGAAIAARCGYADQAHLVREIRRFSGRTPTLLAEADGLTAFFRG